VNEFLLRKAALGHCHSERSEESRHWETLRCAQGDNNRLSTTETTEVRAFGDPDPAHVPLSDVDPRTVDVKAAAFPARCQIQQRIEKVEYQWDLNEWEVSR
jgi:hypothetical protein